MEKETASLQASCKPLAEHGGNWAEVQVQGGRSNTSYKNLVALTVSVAEFLSILVSITSVRVMLLFASFSLLLHSGK